MPGVTRLTTGTRRSSGTRRISTSGPLRAASVALALLAAAAPAVSAQRYWRGSFYPNLSHSTGDGLWIGLHYGRYSPVAFAERPEPNFASINLDAGASTQDRKSTRLNSSHRCISYAVFCLKKKNKTR